MQIKTILLSVLVGAAIVIANGVDILKAMAAIQKSTISLKKSADGLQTGFVLIKFPLLTRRSLIALDKTRIATTIARGSDCLTPGEAMQLMIPTIHLKQACNATVQSLIRAEPNIRSSILGDAAVKPINLALIMQKSAAAQFAEAMISKMREQDKRDARDQADGMAEIFAEGLRYYH